MIGERSDRDSLRPLAVANADEHGKLAPGKSHSSPERFSTRLKPAQCQDHAEYRRAEGLIRTVLQQLGNGDGKAIRPDG
jgi:hypothetical protein